MTIDELIKAWNGEEDAPELFAAVMRETGIGDPICNISEEGRRCGDGYWCSRAIGHTGAHVACGFKYVYAVWGGEDEVCNG